MCVHEHDSSHVFVGKSVGIKKKCNEPKLKTKKLLCSVPARNEEIPKIEGWVFFTVASNSFKTQN